MDYFRIQDTYHMISCYISRSEIKCRREKNPKNRLISVNVLISESKRNFTIPKNSQGCELLDLVFSHLSLTEPQYFGLQFVHPANILVWVDPQKKFEKQWNKIKDSCDKSNPTVKFKIKFYPKDPCEELREEDTRHQFYLEIKRDIYRGKLPCSINTACILASYIAQAELGDYITIEHCPGYLSNLQLLRCQNAELENRISELHKLHRGQLPEDAELNYLDYAKRLEMYGVDLHTLTTTKCGNTQLGVTTTGLILYKNGVTVYKIPWTNMITTSFNRKSFSIKIKRANDGCDPPCLEFTLESSAHAKSVWKSCAEHYIFAKRGGKKKDNEGQEHRAKNRLSKMFSKTRSMKFNAEHESNKNEDSKQCKQNVKRNLRDTIFQQSLLLLSHALGSKTLRGQYEKLYHKNPTHPITIANKKENRLKNRYSNVSPYDCTRVILKHSECGDYINANYVNMKITKGKVNRYIATQGPLSTTTIDFWRMIQQENSHLIVMLTTIMEFGIHKCHQYWPNLGNKHELSHGFWIKSITEQPDSTGSYVFRELILFDKNVKDKRVIQHMQYLAWPDHGVPSDPQLFLRFTKRLENIRASTRVSPCVSDPPTVIHCSAGVGRTGVLILTDTALAMMKATEPVYPMDLLKEMRDQRPGLIQHFDQFRFVCECISEVFAKS